jgi:undecaprenyl-diphosphatase
MVVLKSVLLGVLQGITEFLPISSSGHLAIARSLLRVEYPGVSLEIFVHAATLLAILYVFRKRTISIASSLLNPDREDRSHNLRFVSLVLVAAVPSIIFGFLWQSEVKAMFTNLNAVGVALLLTGSYIFVTRFAHTRKKELGFLDALIIGVSQATALIPGISRSGITISTALLLGIHREKSAEFCFLLAAPVILAATALEMRNILSGAHEVDLLLYIPAFLSAFGAGFLSIKLVLKTLERKRFRDFAYYCWAVGAIVVFLSR